VGVDTIRLTTEDEGPNPHGHHYSREVRDRNAWADVPPEELERPDLAPVGCWPEVRRAHGWDSLTRRYRE